MAHSRFQRFISSLTLVVATAGSVPVVLAQTDDERAGARAAADAGLKAYDAKKYSECVDFFTRAESLVHAPPHLLYLARCAAQIGRLVKARESYLKLKNEVIPVDKPKAFHDAKANADKELAALEPRLPYLNIQVKGGTGKVAVTMDGATVPSALVGVPRPVDPGEHKLQATADGMASKVETVTLKEGQSESVTLELVAGAVATSTTPEPSTTAKPETTAAPTATGADTSAAPTTTSTSTLPPPTDDKGGGGSLRTIGFVTIGVGVVGLIVGGVFFASSSSKKSDADAKFNEYGCGVTCTPAQQSEVKDLDDKATSAKTLAFVSGGVGIAAVGVGLALVFMGGSSGAPKSAKGPTVTPVIGLGSFGLQGTF